MFANYEHHLTVYSGEWLTSRTDFSFFWVNFLFNLLTNKGWTWLKWCLELICFTRRSSTFCQAWPITARVLWFPKEGKTRGVLWCGQVHLVLFDTDTLGVGSTLRVLYVNILMDTQLLDTLSCHARVWRLGTPVFSSCLPIQNNTRPFVDLGHSNHPIIN